MKELTRIIENGNLERASLILKSLANKEKLRILKFISGNPGCISKNIYNTIPIEQAVVSQHLRMLFAEEIVKAERISRKKLLTMNYKKVNRLVTLLEKKRSDNKLLKDMNVDYSKS